MLVVENQIVHGVMDRYLVPNYPPAKLPPLWGQNLSKKLIFFQTNLPFAPFWGQNLSKNLIFFSLIYHLPHILSTFSGSPPYVLIYSYEIPICRYGRTAQRNVVFGDEGILRFRMSLQIIFDREKILRFERQADNECIECQLEHGIR